MQECPTLKLICVAATGTNNIDLEAKKRGIEVKNVAGYSTKSVAQHTFTLLFSLLGQINYYDSYVKSGKYIESPIFTNLEKEYWEISGKIMGIIGLGNHWIRSSKARYCFWNAGNLLFHKWEK